MKRNYSYFLILLVAVVVVVVGYRFEQYYIAKDYVLSVYTPCDTAIHNCFEADPNSADPNFQAGPYEKVEILAHDAPLCLEEHTCSNFSCANISGMCSITYCSEGATDVGENCSGQTL